MQLRRVPPLPMPPTMLQCGTFHTLSRFQGKQRSCSKKLALHAERSRRRRNKEMLMLATLAEQQPLQPQQPQPRQRFGGGHVGAGSAAAAAAPAAAAPAAASDSATSATVLLSLQQRLGLEASASAFFPVALPEQQGVGPTDVTHQQQQSQQSQQQNSEPVQQLARLLLQARIDAEAAQQRQAVEALHAILLRLAAAGQQQHAVTA